MILKGDVRLVYDKDIEVAVTVENGQVVATITNTREKELKARRCYCITCREHDKEINNDTY